MANSFHSSFLRLLSWHCSHLSEQAKLYKTYTVKELLNHQDNWGNNALNIAAFMGSQRCMSILLKAGSNVTHCNVFDDDALNCAAMSRTCREKDFVYLLKHVVDGTSACAVPEACGNIYAASAPAITPSLLHLAHAFLSRANPSSSLSVS